MNQKFLLLQGLIDALEQQEGSILLELEQTRREKDVLKSIFYRSQQYRDQKLTESTEEVNTPVESEDSLDFYELTSAEDVEKDSLGDLKYDQGRKITKTELERSLTVLAHDFADYNSLSLDFMNSQMQVEKDSLKPVLENHPCFIKIDSKGEKWKPNYTSNPLSSNDSNHDSSGCELSNLKDGVIPLAGGQTYKVRLPFAKIVRDSKNISTLLSTIICSKPDKSFNVDCILTSIYDKSQRIKWSCEELDRYRVVIRQGLCKKSNRNNPEVKFKRIAQGFYASKKI